MAARAVSSRAVSSISLAGIIRSARCRIAGDGGAAPGAPALAPALLLVSPELVLDRVDEGLPRSLDDVVGDAHRAPRLVPVARGDEHARLGPGALGLVEDAHLVVEEGHLLEVRVEVLEGLAQRVV